ncbi:integrase/recombinase xerD homolog isoform X2 [Mercenaria mercenaria]|uniref:integrase/recombinase xerD homolog isoform X2 n=1 Tax=Mercenaria mercenaria TaxID=6596 RepID=UPI00234EA904|nr:integrase/recombinase xerD homolog isoform X2 [Mercenaria mercenaria]
MNVHRTVLTRTISTGLRQTLKRKFDEAGVQINNEEQCIDRMATHILSSRADSTVNKYAHQVKTFKDFCISKGFPCDPAHSIHVAMYLSNLIDSGKSDSVIMAAFYGIKWYHSINDFQDPTENVVVKSMLECAKRLNSKPTTKKDVITTEHLIELCNMFSESTDVVVLRDLTMILLSYAGFLRFDEVSELRCSDIDIKDRYISLFIKKSKTDIYRGGKEVLISSGETSACPVAMLQRYLHCSSMHLKSDSYLFRPACRSGHKCFLIDKDKKLSYTRSKECIVSKLKLVAPNLRLGTHSLRASGATTAANAEGISDRCLKRHGRWKSDLAKDGYIDDSLEKKLFITKQLKL